MAGGDGLGLIFGVVGLIFGLWYLIIGGILFFGAVIGWMTESEYEAEVPDTEEEEDAAAAAGHPGPSRRPPRAHRLTDSGSSTDRIGTDSEPGWAGPAGLRTGQGPGAGRSGEAAKRRRRRSGEAAKRRQPYCPSASTP